MPKTKMHQRGGVEEMLEDMLNNERKRKRSRTSPWCHIPESLREKMVAAHYEVQSLSELDGAVRAVQEEMPITEVDLLLNERGRLMISPSDDFRVFRWADEHAWTEGLLLVVFPPPKPPGIRRTWLWEAADTPPRWRFFHYHWVAGQRQQMWQDSGWKFGNASWWMPSWHEDNCRGHPLRVLCLENVHADIFPICTRCKWYHNVMFLQKCPSTGEWQGIGSTYSRLRLKQAWPLPSILGPCPLVSRGQTSPPLEINAHRPGKGSARGGTDCFRL